MKECVLAFQMAKIRLLALNVRNEWGKVGFLDINISYFLENRVILQAFASKRGCTNMDVALQIQVCGRGSSDSGLWKSVNVTLQIQVCGNL